MEELVRLLHQEWLIRLENGAAIFPRTLIIPEVPNKIKVVIGMRRAGKTCYLLSKIQALLKQGIPSSRILYLNLEDDRLHPLDFKKLGTLVDAFYALYPENHHSPCYLFLDEIQSVEGWARLVRRLQDTKRAEIYLTGSSAKLLSKEIATELRGRSIAYEMWPFDFSEYLSAKSISLPLARSKIEFDLYKKYLEEYLLLGGFPEVTLLDFPERNRVLSDYVDIVVYRDVIERHKISNLSVIRYMLQYLIKNFSTNLALNKFYNDLKSQGFSVGRHTIYEYLEYLKDAYLLFNVPLFSESIRKVQSNPKKIYAIDMGLSNAYLLGVQYNWGRLFENMIYLDLRRRGDEVYYYLTSERYEVDFLTRSRDGQLHLYQVAWDLDDPKSLARENRALQAAEAELGIKGKVLTPHTYCMEREFMQEAT